MEKNSVSIPSFEHIDYNQIKHICINGVSPKLCDMICEDYNSRCGCVRKHFENLNNGKDNRTIQTT